MIPSSSNFGVLVATSFRGNATQRNATQRKAKQSKAEQSRAKQSKTELRCFRSNIVSNAMQRNSTKRVARGSNAKQSKAKQRKTEQSKAMYSKVKQRTIKKSIIFNWVRAGFILTCMLVFTVAGASPSSKVFLGSAGASLDNDVCAFVSGMLG